MRAAARRRALPAGGALLALLGALAGASAATPDAEERAHAAHHAAPAQAALRRSTVTLELPDVRLVRDDGLGVSLAAELDDGRPVYVDFIYTSCTAICPVTSATFAALQERLGTGRDRVHMLSISIDPEEDTPQRLREFRARYGAGPQWRHYTGSAEASIAVQRAFGVYTGDKMGHMPVTLFRAAPGRPWIRLDGFATPDELYREVRLQLAGR